MRVAIGIGIAVLLGAVWYYQFAPQEPAISINRASSGESQHAPPSDTIIEAAEVFRKAFWKQPAQNDKILHAERREWVDAGGLTKWQWFIVVEPSTQLLKHLREDNAFSLTAMPVAPENAGAPSWFSFDPSNVDVMSSPTGNLSLVFSKTGNLLFATDQGGGFVGGVADAPKLPTSPPASVGRLPSTAPPLPTD